MGRSIGWWGWLWVSLWYDGVRKRMDGAIYDD